MIKQYLLKGAQDYYNHLDEEQLGLEELRLKIINKIGSILYITPFNPILTTDFLSLKLDSLILIEDLGEVKYFESSNTIEIKLNDNCQDLDFKNARLFVDLKFLVKNFIDFLCNDLEFALPKKRKFLWELEIPDFANDEQKEAIKGIFSNPMSYVWGVSGSGKTQVVLLYAILNLIKNKRKVLILAPTNSALDQILAALMEKFSIVRVSEESILRLGIPTNKYFEKYPQTCESKEGGSLFFKDRIECSLVIGITLDGFVKRYNLLKNANFKHIFLDECAFAPLIKIIPPLSLNIPITLLGDHKQLMPVCQMKEEIIQTQYKEVCTWNLNTLFLQNLLNDSQNLHLRHNYDDIDFKDIKLFSLTTTHRYGNNLARVLDFHVYKNSLKGLGEPTKIYYVDAAKYTRFDNDIAQNVSHREAHAIKDIISYCDDYAVITPFKNQVKALLDLKIDRTKVFTIHKSQGSEFNSVIFSPVKLSRYLSNSNNLNALFALNVAVSRLKKELIIVCDYNFWMNQKNQFITSLLKIAMPFSERFDN